MNYCFGRWTKAISYPYFVGEYIEKEVANEDGERQTDFILTGTTDKSYLSLEKEKEKIRSVFTNIGEAEVFDDGSGIAVCYRDAFFVPTNTENLKRMQINLKVLEWSVN